MSHSLKLLKGGLGIMWETTIGDIRGDTRSLDYSSYELKGMVHSVVSRNHLSTETPVSY